MRSLYCLLLLACPLFAAPPSVEIPAEELIPVNGYILMTPKGDAKGVTYVALSGVYPLPSKILADGRMFALPVTGLKAGKYDFVAVASLNDEHTSRAFSVNIGLVPVPPVPVPPGPNPTPIPPAPVPTPGADVDPVLLAKLAAVLLLDVAMGADKKKAADLATVYDSGATLLTLKDPAVAPKTFGDLYAKSFAASVAKNIPRLPYLKETRTVIDAYIGQENGMAPMTDELRDKYRAKYAVVAATLAEATK